MLNDTATFNNTVTALPILKCYRWDNPTGSAQRLMQPPCDGLIVDNSVQFENIFTSVVTRYKQLIPTVT